MSCHCARFVCYSVWLVEMGTLYSYLEDRNTNRDTIDATVTQFPPPKPDWPLIGLYVMQSFDVIIAAPVVDTGLPYLPVHLATLAKLGDFLSCPLQQSGLLPWEVGKDCLASTIGMVMMLSEPDVLPRPVSGWSSSGGGY